MDFALNTLKFEDVREQIIKYLSENNPYNGQFNFRSSNIGYFIDAMAYVAMTMNYNVSQVANNIFLDTTDIRKNGVSRAREIGYTPKRPMSAKFRGRLTYKGINFAKGNKLTINARSPFVGSFGNIYYNMQPIELTYQGNPTELVGDYTLAEGSFKYFKVNATGQANFSFKVANKNIDDENLTLFVIPKAEVEKVENGLLTEPYNLQAFLQYKWERVKTFKEIMDSKVYYVEEDVTDEGAIKIVFGNGIFGAIPTDSDVVFCEYFETKGGAGNNENLISLPPKNVVEGTTDVYVYYNTFDMGIENKNAFSVDSFLSGNAGYQNIYNKSYGGSDIESLNDIKFNAPRFYSSAGRAVTQNDYIYILKTINGVGDASVTGGMDLYPNNYEELGNIYICVVPIINPLEFLYINSIYIAPTLADEIRALLKDVSIISTTRHFYKPSYIIVDITPNVELARTVTQSEQAKIQEQVKTLIQTYFNNTYNKLGIPFRESKVSVPIDNLSYIVSSFVELGFSFVINNETVAGLVEGLNNIIYLPTRKAKDAQGKTIQVGQVFENGVEIFHGYTKLTNFIMTNSQVVRYEILPNEDWSILDSTYTTLTPDEKTLWRTKQHKMINALSSILPEQCSIYNSGLIHDTLQRALYNDDFTNTKIMELTFASGVQRPTVKSWSYTDFSQQTVFSRIVWDDVQSNVQTGKIYFGFSSGDNAVLYEVADIVTTLDALDYTKSTVRITITDYSGTGGENQPENLAIYFNIDSAQYVFFDDYMNKLPFKIFQNAPGRYEIDVRLLTSTTNLTIDGTFPLYNVAKDGLNYPATPASSKVTTSWIYEDQFGSTPYSTIKYNGTDVAVVESSHKLLANGNRKFFDYIGILDSQINVSDIDLLASTVENSTTAYPLGSYFIVATAFESGIDRIGYCQVNDILFVDNTQGIESTASDLILRKTDIKKFVSSANNANVLTTNLHQGDLFINDGGTGLEDYLMYDTSYTGAVLPSVDYFRDVIVRPEPASVLDPSGYSVDASVLLPRELTDNYMVRIVYDGSDPLGVQVNYPQSAHDKIGTLYHRQSSDGEWVDMGTSNVMDGDLLIYGQPNGFGTPVWMLIENVERDTLIPDPTGRIEVGAGIPTGLLSDLDVGLYNIYKVNTPIEVRDAADVAMIVNLPIDGIINPGDYLICINEDTNTYPDGLWRIFDNDYFEYHINVSAGATNESSKFPFLTNPAMVYRVYGNGNFGGQTGLVDYVDGEYIMYIGDNTWKKYDTTSAISYVNRVDSKLGDIIAITDSAGDFGSDLTKLDCPISPLTQTMLFSKSDLLYFTGTHWIKVKPYNAYNNPLVPSTKDLINTAGFKSDFKVKQQEKNVFQVYLYDLFDKQVIGRMDYFTGKLILSLKVNKYINDDAAPQSVSITEIFKRENYRNNARQMDVVRMKAAPVDFGYQGDFDTNFNQYILADVKNTVII